MVLSPVLKIEFEEVNDLPETLRGSGGFWFYKVNEEKSFHKANRKIFKTNSFEKRWYHWSKKILDSSVLVVGAGGLGCPVVVIYQELGSD